MIVAAACSGTQQAATNEFRVALVTPGPVSDRSWNGSAYEGLEFIRDSLGAKISHVQAKTPADFEENFRQYGAAGYSIVIGHGFEFQDAAKRVAPAYPRTVYLITGGRVTGENLASVSFAFEEPSYLAGMAAAAASRTGMVACVGGTQLPTVKSSFRAFAAGASAIRPQVSVITAYLGNWDDASAGREQALALARRGVDVIFQDADAAGLGVFQAAREQRALRIIGSNANQNDVAPRATLGSVVIDVPRALLLLATQVKDGSFTPRLYRFTTKEEVVRWVPNPALMNELPAADREQIASTASLMRQGRFTLPPTP
ncbi:MAG: BMP family protein [Gemmatimonadaceae bacterium]|nr:BMP family protein [Gemmatimonadaceae bacterium]